MLMKINHDKCYYLLYSHIHDIIVCVIHGVHGCHGCVELELGGGAKHLISLSKYTTTILSQNPYGKNVSIRRVV